MTMVVPASGTRSPMRYTSSPPGTLMAPGMVMRWNSSIGLLSSTTIGVPLVISACSSGGSRLSVW